MVVVLVTCHPLFIGCYLMLQRSVGGHRLGRRTKFGLLAKKWKIRTRKGLTGQNTHVIVACSALLCFLNPLWPTNEYDQPLRCLAARRESEIHF